MLMIRYPPGPKICNGCFVVRERAVLHPHSSTGSEHIHRSHVWVELTDTEIEATAPYWIAEAMRTLDQPRMMSHPYVYSKGPFRAVWRSEPYALLGCNAISRTYRENFGINESVV